MPAPSQSAPRRTALYERHVREGARVVEFAGWEMPVQYEHGIRAEHMAVRERCGMFDVSHMGQIETQGPHAKRLLQRVLSNDVSRIPIGGAQYSVMCAPDGGVLDDLFTYRLAPERYLTVTNAANHEGDLKWFQSYAAGLEVEVRDRIEDWAMLAVQGPLARETVQAISDAPLPARMTAGVRRLIGVEALVCGTGYTGEDGVELLVAPAEAPGLWDELRRRGAEPAGLGARDTLRLEACFPLHGHELTPQRNPIEAGLGWCCREETEFTGSEAVRRTRAEGPPEKLVAFHVDGPGIARAGNPIVGGGQVTSGTLSPCLEVGVGMAYVPAERAALGTKLTADVRGKMRTLTVTRKPLYRKA